MKNTILLIHCVCVLKMIFVYYFFVLIVCTVLQVKFMMSDSEATAVTVDKLYIKKCFIPSCSNDSFKNSNKLFFSLTKNQMQREICIQAILEGTGVLVQAAHHSGRYICEDHYNLEIDVGKWSKYDLKAKCLSEMVKLKPDAVPTKFCTCNAGNLQCCIHEGDMPPVIYDDGLDLAEEVVEISGSASEEQQTTENSTEIIQNDNAHIPSSQSSQETTRYESSQGDKPAESDSTWSPGINSQCYSQDSCLSKTESEKARREEIEREKVFKEQCCKIHTKLIENKPKVYLGIEKTFYFLIGMLASLLPNNSINYVHITLFKIKQNNSFEVIGDYFGMSSCMAGRVFSTTLPILSINLKKFIFRPHLRVIKLNLPTAFRYQYFNVCDLIDCFEIQIEKPGNSLHQALTWSDYKKGNTIKYFIACTPDGFITFVSCGYGGKISDTAIIRECGYFDTLEPGMVVMADRGFKFVEKDLHDIQCHLVRPPSVAADEVLGESESIAAKQIAALRVHVERCIGRVREFAMVAPHATTDNKLIDMLDDAVITACALVNSQSKLIKG